MSSDTFRYHVDRVEGRDVWLTIRPSGAAGFCDLASTRSFVLMLLAQRGLAVSLDQCMDQAWLRAHLDEYVTAVVPERLVGLRHEEILRKTASTWHIPASHYMPRLTLRVTLASGALAAHLPEGASGGTVAFDALYEPAQGPLTLSGEEPPRFDPQPDLAYRVEVALLERLPGWRRTGLDGLHRVGVDGWLRIHLSDAFTHFPRGNVHVTASVHVPAFDAVLEAGPSGYIKTQLVDLTGCEPGSMSAFWHRRYVGASSAPQLEYFEEDAPQEPFDALVDRIAAALAPPGLDALLTRDGLRGLVESQIPSMTVQKGRPKPSPIGAWPSPEVPPSWRFDWAPRKSYLAEPIWARVTLHAAFGSPDDAQTALAQARGISKKVPAVMKPFIASLDGAA